MCGILAVIGDYRYVKIPESLIERGRDGCGIYQDEHVQLMQTRLQITGNDTIDLPIQNDIWVVLFNGQIYNYKELNEKFLKMYDFKYDSDFETVLYGFSKYGKDFFTFVNGQYAVFAYNKKTQEHYTIVDDYRIKTLYKHRYEGSLFYSSNLRCLPGVTFKSTQTTGYGNVTSTELL